MSKRSWLQGEEPPDVTEQLLIRLTDGAEAIAQAAHPFKSCLIACAGTQHRVGSLMHRQGVERVIAVPPQSQGMTKLMQSRRFENLCPQLGRHQNIHKWLAAPDPSTCEQRQLQDAAAVAGSPTTIQPASWRALTINSNLGAVAVDNPRDRNQFAPVLQCGLNTQSPAAAPTVNGRWVRIDPDTPPGQRREAKGCCRKALPIPRCRFTL